MNIYGQYLVKIAMESQSNEYLKEVAIAIDEVM